MKQNDTAPSVKTTLLDGDGDAVDITGATIRFHMKDVKDGTVKVDGSMVIKDPTNGVAWYIWSSGDTDTLGTYYVEFEVTYPGGSIETFPNNKSLTLLVKQDLA